MQNTNRYNTHTTDGFILTEILISLSIIAFVIVPLTLFVIHKNDINSYMDDVWDTDAYVRYGLFSSSTLRHLFEPTTQSIKNCNVLFSHIESRIQSHTPEFGSMSRDSRNQIVRTFFERDMQVQTFELLHHERNRATSLETLEYEQGHVFMYIGTNSSSTTDSDLYVIEDKGTDSASPVIDGQLSINQTDQQSQIETIAQIPISSTTARFVLHDAISYGPGIIDMARSGNQIVIAERSTVLPIRILNVHREQVKNQLYITGQYLRSAYPKTVFLDGDYLLIGTEKNPYAELYSAKIPQHNTQGVSPEDIIAPLVFTGGMTREIEIGSGINSIHAFEDYIAIASPKNPEYEFFDRSELFAGIPSAYSTSSVSPSFVIDAPGSSGNGKSMFSNNRTLFLGRTVGNNELLISRMSYLHIKNKHIPQIKIASKIIQEINTNNSIVQLQSVLNGKYLLALTNTTQSSMVIYRRNDHQGNTSPIYSEIIRIPTDTEVVDYDCALTRFYVLQNNNSVTTLEI